MNHPVRSTRGTRITRSDRRRLEAELRSDPTPIPAPPVDLLDKIRREIPNDLAAANAVPGSGERRNWLRSAAGFRLAATIAIGVVGVSLAFLTQRESSRLASAGVDATPPPTLSFERPSTVVQSEAGPFEARPSRELSIEAKDDKTPVKGKNEQAESLEGRRQVVESSGVESLSAAYTEGDAQPSIAPGAPPAPAEAGADRAELSALGYVDGAEPTASPKLRFELSDSSAAASSPAPPPPARAQAPTTPSMEASRSGRLDDARANEGSNRREGEKRVQSVESQESVSGKLFGRLSGRDSRDQDEEESQVARERAPADMYFRATGTNPFVDSREDALSTFALDVDTGSYTLVRSYLERGTLPPSQAIRVEEFVNAQRYDDPAPRRGEFTLTAEGAPSPFVPDDRYRLLRFAVKAREVGTEERKPANLTFVVDVSGSMDRENRLGLVKRALGLLLDELDRDDRVGLVVYGTHGRVLLSHTRDHEAIRAAIARLVPEGSTNAEQGLKFGYDLADEAWREGWINRVILCSDGVANVGATGPESILERIGKEARRGIALTTVGFGMGNYNDALMEQLADQGDGSYHYVDQLDEARKVFVENLTGTLQTVAKDAKVQVEFDPATVERWRLVGYENRDVADRDFRNDRIDAGEVGAGQSATAVYEVRLRDDARGSDALATLRLRWKSVDGGRVVEAHQDLTVADVGRSFDRASRDLRVAAVAADFAERLKGTRYTRDGGWRDLRAEADRLRREFPRDPSIGELTGLIDRAIRLGGAEEDRRER